MTSALTNATTPQLRRDPSVICQFATQLSQTQAIAACGGEVGVVFLGDSITQNWAWTGDTWSRTWAPRKSLNYGIGGDQTGHLLLRVQNGLLDGISPKAVVQMIGVNNCWANPSAEEVADGIAACLAAVRVVQPTVRILCGGILPLDHGCASYDSLVKRINQLLPAIAATYRADFREVGNALRNADGSITPGLTTDGCHLGAAAYSLMSAEIDHWYKV